jgi:predicted phosphodiesterase
MTKEEAENLIPYAETSTQAKALRCVASSYSMSEAAEKYGSSVRNIQRIVSNVRRSAERRGKEPHKEVLKMPWQNVYESTHKPIVKDGLNRVLVIGDCHAPAMHPDYVPFLKSIYEKHKCNRVVHIGDSVDWNAISFHEKDPAMPSPEQEYKEAYKQIQELYKAFPVLDYLKGNHSDLPSRKARHIGLPESVIMPFEKIWNVEGWNIHPRYHDLIIDGVIYRHGDKGKGGQRIAALANAKDEHKPVVQGHLHAQFGIEFAANHDRVIWGMQVGCGTAPNHPNMSYSRVYSARPILGCGLVLEGEPYLERMKL